MTETAELLHHTPGRLRIRIASGKGQPSRLRQIQEALACFSGVRRVDINAMLGTLVVQYDPAFFPGFAGALATHAARLELFKIPCEDTGPCVSQADRSIDRILGQMNRTVQQALGNAINLKELLPLALGAYGLLFVDRAVAMSQWLNWLQFAFDIYIDLHEAQPVVEVGRKVDAVGARILEQQECAAEALRAELSALRADLRELMERLPVREPSS
jgi:hypothetical protein